MPAAKLCQPAHGRLDARKGLRVTKISVPQKFLETMLPFLSSYRYCRELMVVAVRQECRERSRIKRNGGYSETFQIEIPCDVRRALGACVRGARSSWNGQLRYQQADYREGRRHRI